MNPALKNLFKLGASCGAAALGFYFDPDKLQGAAKFLTQTLSAVAPNFVHQFLSKYEPEQLFQYINSPHKLNHDIEKLMIASVPEAIKELQKKYENDFDDDREIKLLFKRLIEDAADKPYDRNDEEIMVNDRNAWLEDIITYIFTVGDWEKEDGRLDTLKLFFKENFLNCFNLVFTEGLKNPADERPLKAFLIKTLEGIAQQTSQSIEFQTIILQEIQDLKVDKQTSSFKAAKRYFEDINIQLQELLHITKEIREDVKVIRGILENQPTHTHYLTAIPQLGTFLGRDVELQNLSKILEEAKQVVLVNGIGGIGKTTLARAYVYHNQHKFKHIAWINVIGTTIQEAFVNTTYFNKSLQNAQLIEGDTNARFMALMTAIREISGNGLLVIDNTEKDIEDIKDILPPSPQWQILLTSRLDLRTFEEVSLDKLSEESAIALFKEYYKKPIKEQAYEILLILLKEIDYHTLTIELIAKTIRESDSNLRFDEVLEKLKNRQLNDKKMREVINVAHLDDRQAILYNHLITTFSLANLSEYQIWVLKQFAALPPEPILKDTLIEWLKLDENEADKFSKTLKELQNKGWIKRTNDIEGKALYSIHRLIQDMVLYQHPIIFEDIEILVKSFKGLLDFNISTDFSLKFQYLQPAEYVLKTLPNDLENSSIGVLYNNLGSVYQEFADYQKAEKYLWKALIIYQNKNNTRNIATLQSNLALVYRNLGNYEKARDLLEQALASDLQNFGNKHPNVANSQSNLANVYSDLENYGKARDLLEQALASNLQNFENRHPNVANSQSNLANVYRNLGNYEKARDLYEETLASDLQNFGNNHPTVALRKWNLATTLVSLGNLQEAYLLLEESYATFKNQLGDNHPHTKSCLEWLEGVKKILGK